MLWIISDAALMFKVVGKKWQSLTIDSNVKLVPPKDAVNATVCGEKYPRAESV